MGRSGNGPKNRDDDHHLLLFRELRRREKERIATLLQPVSDEFGPNSGPAPYALFRISKPSSTGYDLSIDKDKSDFNWLKTPPATPLFPSLEMEATTAELVVQRDLPIHPLSRFAAGGNKARPKTPNSRAGLPSRSAAGPTNRPNSESKPNSGTIPKASNYQTHKHSNSIISSNSNPGFTTKSDALNTRKLSKAAEFDGFSDKAPPNLRTDRPASATRGRPAANPKKPEPKLMPRRQSCSPAVARRDHDQPNKSKNCGKAMNPTATGNQVMGSRMVDKLMSARKSNASTADHNKETITISRSPKSVRADMNSNVFKQAVPSLLLCSTKIDDMHVVTMFKYFTTSHSLHRR